MRVPNLVGMRYLSELLTRPGQLIPALTLASQGMASPPSSRQELLDDDARAAYAARARELTGDLADAEADNDLVRAEKLRVELDALVEELESTTGLGGRSRTFTDAGERARSSVSKAIKRAIDAIDDASPAIADALRATVNCGVVCSYVPDAQAPVTWSASEAEARGAAQTTEPAGPVVDVPAPSDTIGRLGRRAARRWFVGRDEQVDLLRSALASVDRPFSVLFVHGPGGVGKTMLLGALAAEAATAGVRVVRLDMHTIAPSSAAFLARFAAEPGDDDIDVTPDALADAGPLAVLIDTFERAGALTGWLWEQFVASLPSDALVVIAGRNPPPATWRAEPRWRALARVVALGNFSAEQSRHYLELRDVEASLHDRLVTLTHGHPLALSLVVDVLEQRPDQPGRLELIDAPDVVSTLVEQFVGDIPDPRRREALAVCALARFTTEDLLRAATGGDDAGDLLAWLRSLSFVEEGREGLFPHDLARDVLDTDLRWRDPSRYQDLHLRVQAHVIGRIRGSAGRARRKAVTDTLYLARRSPVMAPLYDWSGLGAVEVDPLIDGDHDLVLTMAERDLGPSEAQLVRHWLDRQPESFLMFRLEGSVVGFTSVLRLDRAAPADIATDPGTRAARAFWTHHDPPRPGEVVTMVRFVAGCRHPGVAPSPAWEGFSLAHILTLLTTRLAWDFIAAFTSPDLQPVFDYIDYHRVLEAEFTSGGEQHLVFAHDWRRRDWQAFMDMLGRRALDDGSGIVVPAGA